MSPSRIGWVPVAGLRNADVGPWPRGYGVEEDRALGYLWVMDRAYYSQRIGRGPLANPTIQDLARALKLTVNEMEEKDYLQEWHGYHCIDAGDVRGRAGVGLSEHIEAETGWRDAWPLRDPLVVLDLEEGMTIPERKWDRLVQEAEDKLFDLIEYFHDHVSAGIEDAGDYHGYGRCGWHYQAFDPARAQALFRKRMNRTLMNYEGGFRINENGQIEHTADEGFDQLIDAALPTKDPDIARRVAGAIALYRNRARTEEDLRLAVRELFDVLEKLRPEVKAEMLRADEGALFNIANNFTIRHLNEQQKGNYDSAVWHSWTFYVNLATIHVITRLVNRRAHQGPPGKIGHLLTDRA
jgi:hypothetical protein